jgi:hypothetical protein
MTDKIMHVAHCTYSNGDIDYEWNKDVGETYHTFNNLYAITVTVQSEMGKQALGTIIVKTDMGQTKEELGRIYSSVRTLYKKLESLPTKNISLISTKANAPEGHVLSETELLKIMTDMYVQNASAGNA